MWRLLGTVYTGFTERDDSEAPRLLGKMESKTAYCIRQILYFNVLICVAVIPQILHFLLHIAFDMQEATVSTSIGRRLIEGVQRALNCDIEEHVSLCLVGMASCLSGWIHNLNLLRIIALLLLRICCTVTDVILGC